MPDAAHMPASMDDTKIQCKADQRRQERKNHGKQNEFGKSGAK